MIYDIDENSDVPSFLNAGIYGVEILVNELDKNEADFLHSMGYKDRLKLDFGVSYRYQSTDNLFDLTKLSIREKDLGELSASVKLGNLSLSKTELIGLLFTYPLITVHEAKLSFDNDALLEKVIQARAKQVNKSDNAVREETIREIEQQLTVTKNGYMQTTLHALKSFIQNPGKLEVHLSPERPLSIRQLTRFRDPNQLMAALHLSVTNG